MADQSKHVTVTGRISRAPYGDVLFVRVDFGVLGDILLTARDGGRVDYWEPVRVGKRRQPA